MIHIWSSTKNFREVGKFFYKYSVIGRASGRLSSIFSATIFQGLALGSKFLKTKNLVLRSYFEYEIATNSFFLNMDFQKDFFF